MPSTITANETTTNLVDLKNKLIDSSSSLKSTMSNNSLLEKQDDSNTSDLPSPIITNNNDINPLSNNGADLTQLPTNLDYNDLDVLIKMERANKLAKLFSYFFYSNKIRILLLLLLLL
jgi:hypothetical protein